MTTNQYIALSGLVYVDLLDYTDDETESTLGVILNNIEARGDFDLDRLELHPLSTMLDYKLLYFHDVLGSGFQGAAFQAPDNADGTPGEIVFTFRGTESLTLSDIITDAQIAGAMGDLPGQFSDALAFVNSVTGGDYSNVSFTGHSLGGGIKKFRNLGNFIKNMHCNLTSVSV